MSETISTSKWESLKTFPSSKRTISKVELVAMEASKETTDEVATEEGSMEETILTREVIP